ncbi:linear amide C-N hydrolase [uncultured Shewanella sp.]|uniref:linear amide C-N hydrolase n=1 Tax=uncultured Shewanella sp. TaxID=173975 RepID=UPI00261B5929|nr:linear amide C-N hydrolase [uncultured Shewanella sp.]
MCTNFSITGMTLDPNKNIPIIGRSMELGPNLKSELFFRGAGFDYIQGAAKELTPYSLPSDEFVIRNDITKINEKLYSWQGKYDFVAMNGFEASIVENIDVSEQLANIATNGMNKEGLTTGTMVLAQSQYQEPLKTNGEFVDCKGVIYYPSITTWILSNCGTCQDVIDGLEYDKLVVHANGSKLLESKVSSEDKLLVASPFSTMPNAMKFHFHVQDAQGNAIVLEYVKGKLTITDLNPIGVLTNDPLIAWQQENVIYNYVDVMPFNFQNNASHPAMPSTEKYQNAASRFECFSYAQGTGFSTLPGSSTPLDRFVRAAMMTNFAFPVYQLSNEEEILMANSEGLKYRKEALSQDIKVGKEDASTLAFHVLNTVDIPQGTSRDASGEWVHDYTQWVTVSDLVNKKFSMRMYESPQVFSLDLNKLDFKKLEQEAPYRLDIREKSLDITHRVNEGR